MALIKNQPSSFAFMLLSLYKRVRPEAGIIGVVGIVALNVITFFRHNQRNAIPNDSFAAGCCNSLYKKPPIPLKDDNIPIGQISV